MVGVRLRVHSTVGYLASDLEHIAGRVKPEMRGIVREGIKAGEKAGKAFARRSSGSHGPHYIDAITSEMTGPLEGEWGPDVSKPQGDMSWERGSVNQPPHNDMAKAADVIAPKFHEKVERAVNGWFW